MAVDSIKTNNKYKPIILLILDGWGLSPSWGGNAIAMNNPPNINSYWRQYPHKILQAFQPVDGESSGVGNSEIGHASIGTGRMVEQDLTDINKCISDGSFYSNPVLVEACKKALENNSALHLLGLVSDGSVHSHINHLYALLKLAKIQKVNKVYIHAITDGRDVSATSAIQFITDIEKKIEEVGVGEIATICGRDYAMDRNDNWEKIEAEYKALIQGIGRIESEPLKAISNLYREGFTDEFIPPTIIHKNNKPIATVRNGDSIIFFNFRADRARELTRAFCDERIFKSLIKRKYPTLNCDFVSMTDYKLNLNNLEVAFASAKIDSNLAKIISDHQMNQLHIAESEKYAHVTYFFNGGQEESYSGEDRIIIKSNNSVPYDQKPEMGSEQITKKTVDAIKSKKYDFILVNFANVDMVGHTGNILAASKAVEIVDKSVSKIVEASLKQNGLVIITADHGNAEQMLNTDTSSDPETMHSLNPVPFIIIGNGLKKNLLTSANSAHKFLLSDILSSSNTLADVAPTILEIMNIAKPTDMTGTSLLNSLE